MYFDNYEDDMLNLIKSYKRQEPVNYCLSITSAKRIIVDKWRRGALSANSAGRVLTNITKMERNYSPTPDCSFQNLLNLRYKDLYNGFLVASKIKRNNENELTATAQAIENYVLEQRVVDTQKDAEGNDVSKQVYTLSELFGIEDVVVKMYQEFEEKAKKSGFSYDFDEKVTSYIADSIAKEKQEEIEEDKLTFEHNGHIYEDELESL